MNDEPDEICVTLPDFSIAVTRDEPSLLALAAEWDALHARSRTRLPYTRRDWIALCWVRRRSERGSRLHLVTVRHAGRLVALLPLRTEPAIPGLRLVRWIDSATPFYSDVLHEDTPEGAAALAHAARFLLRDRKLLRFKLENIPDDAAALPFLATLGATAGSASLVGTLDLSRYPDKEAFVAGQPFYMRRDYRATLRRLAQRGTVTSQRLTNPTELDEAVNWIFATKAEQLRNKGTLSAWFSDPRTSQLFASAAQDGLRSNACRVYGLKLDGRLIAAELVFASPETGYVSKSAMDASFGNLSIGTVVRFEAMLALHAEGCRTINFMLGEFPWKERMRTGTQTVATYRAPGRLLRALRGARTASA